MFPPAVEGSYARGISQKYTSQLCFSHQLGRVTYTTLAPERSHERRAVRTPAEEEAVLGSAGDGGNAATGQVTDLGGGSLVPEGAAAQLPSAVAAPAEHAALRDRHSVCTTRSHCPYTLRAIKMCQNCEAVTTDML